MGGKTTNNLSDGQTIVMIPLKISKIHTVQILQVVVDLLPNAHSPPLLFSGGSTFYAKCVETCSFGKVSLERYAASTISLNVNIASDVMKAHQYSSFNRSGLQMLAAICPNASDCR